MGSLPEIIWCKLILLNMPLYVNMPRVTNQDCIHVMGCGLVIGLNFHVVIRGNHILCKYNNGPV